MPALTEIERRLLEELDEARETIRQLRAVPPRKFGERFRYHGFSAKDAALLDCLAAGGIQRSSVLRRRTGTTPKALGIVVMRLRLRLAAECEKRGSPVIRVQTVRGVGYMMTEGDIVALRSLEVPVANDDERR